MLAAMDAIVDRDEGKIDEERVEAINSNVAFITGNLERLDELADSEEERLLSTGLHGLLSRRDR